MNNAFGRMKALLEPLGLSFEEGSITGAEIYAYSAGIELVKNMLDKAWGSIFFNDGKYGSLDFYAELLKLDSTRYEPAQLKSAVVNRIRHSYADYTANDLREMFNSIGSGDYLIVNNELIISAVNEKDLGELGKFMEAYVCFAYPFKYDGDGMTFDEWDEWSKTFCDYDDMRLPFDILDYLRRDNY